MSSGQRSGTPMGYRLGAVLVALAAGLAATPAGRAQSINGVAVSVVPGPTRFRSGQTHHGYVEYRVNLLNRTSQTRQVTLRLPGRTFGTAGDSIGRITRRVSLAGGMQKPVTVSLLQPPVELTGSSLAVTVDGVSRDVSIDLAEHARRHGRYRGHSIRPPVVLMSKSVDPSFRDSAKLHAASGVPDLYFFQQEIPPAQWSTRWLGYSRYDGVVVTDEDMRAMPEAAVEALRQYVALGGSLTVMGPWQPPPAWRSEDPAFTGATESRAHTTHLGFGLLRRTGPTEADEITHEQYQRWFGRVWRSNVSAWQHVRGVQQANRDFPIVEDLGVPAEGLLVLMILFAVTIGPVNLWVLGRKRRRMWLLWTVPAISLAACLMIWVYAVASEGFSADRRIETITVLDQEHRTAATLGLAAYYAPLTPGEGLKFDPHTELTPQLARYRRHGGGRSRTVRLTHGQNLDSGWVIARVPAHFMVRKPHVNVRQRLTVRRAAGGAGYRVTNGLGADLLRVWYADDAGNVYEATGDANAPAARAGESVTLLAAAAERGVPRWRELYTRDWIGSLEQVQGSPPSKQAQRLAPNTYLAVLDGQPFIEAGLEGSDVRRERACVLGIVGPSTQGASNDTD